MISNILLFVVLIGGIALCSLKLIGLLFPKNSFYSNVIEKGGKKVLGKINETLDKGRGVASQAEEIIDGLEEFLDGSLPKPLQQKGREGKKVIGKARDMLDQAKVFIENPSSLTSEPTLRFLLSTISYESQPLFRDFRKGNLYVITDDPDHPFQITPLISQTASSIVKGASSSEAKARSIFNWMHGSVKYGETKRKSGAGYRTSSEVFSDREGVCGEMGILYVVMARSVGLKSNFVHVTKDNSGRNVSHACASVRINGKDILVDPAYHTFDIDHMKYEILPDREAVNTFESMR